MLLAELSPKSRARYNAVGRYITTQSYRIPGDKCEPGHDPVDVTATRQSERPENQCLSPRAEDTDHILQELLCAIRSGLSVRRSLNGDEVALLLRTRGALWVLAEIRAS